MKHLATDQRLEMGASVLDKVSIVVGVIAIAERDVSLTGWLGVFIALELLSWTFFFVLRRRQKRALAARRAEINHQVAEFDRAVSLLRKVAEKKAQANASP